MHKELLDNWHETLQTAFYSMSGGNGKLDPYNNHSGVFFKKKTTKLEKVLKLLEQ